MTLTWDTPVRLASVEVKCDANVKRNILMRKASRVDGIFRNDVPTELLKALADEVLMDGEWRRVGSVTRNRVLLVRLAFEPVETTAVRITLQETYGYGTAKLFEVRCYTA